MKDFNDKLKERWEQKRSKAKSWTGLLIKIAILAVILYAVHKLSTSKNIDWSVIKSKPDTVQVAPDSIKGR
jgi:hypothetical protein